MPSTSDCIAYAQKSLAKQNWACYAGTLSNYGANTSGKPKSSKTFTRPVGRVVTTEARINDYFSNTTEPLVASIKASGTRPINLKVGLYDHSPAVTMSYTSSTAVSAT